MPGVAQRRTRLGGNWYDRGAAVPDEFVTARTIAMGLVTSASSEPGAGGSGGAALAAELERTKAALAAATAQLEEAGITLNGEGDAQPFDPAEHTVGDVLAHVEANPDERERVLDAELGGKARKTLLDELERRQVEAAGEAGDDKGSDAGGE